MTTELKTCTRCQEAKPLTEYYDDSRTYCNDCQRETSRDRMRKYTATMRGKASKALTRSKSRAAEFGVEDDLTLLDVLFTFAMADRQCAYCGKVSEDYQLEHILPMSKGHPNTLSNITVACIGCNSSKGNHDLLRWHSWSGRAENEGILQTIERMALRRGVCMQTIIDELQAEASEYTFGEVKK